MKVLFWMTTSFQTTSRHLLTSMIKELYLAGNDVTVLQRTFDGDDDYPEELKQYPIRRQCVSVKNAEKRNLIGRYFSELDYVLKCGKYITESYDAVFLQSSNVLGASVRTIRNKLPKAVITVNVQDIFPYNAVFSGKLDRRGIPFKILAGIQRYAYTHADHIITISEDMKKLLVEDNAEEKKISVVYNWSYQDEPYEEEKIRSEVVDSMFDRKYVNVVYAGNIGVMQNVELVIRMAEKMQQDPVYRFHIIGDGVYKDRLKAEAEEAGLKNLTFWPMLPAQLAPAVYSRADVNIIPLIKDIYRTALPSKTATCLACHKPILFAIGEDSEFGRKLSEETGCPVLNSDDLTGCVDALKKINSGALKCSTEDYYLKYFLKTQNSRRYADIITQK